MPGQCSAAELPAKPSPLLREQEEISFPPVMLGFSSSKKVTLSRRGSTRMAWLSLPQPLPCSGLAYLNQLWLGAETLLLPEAWEGVGEELPAFKLH